MKHKETIKNTIILVLFGAVLVLGTVLYMKPKQKAERQTKTFKIGQFIYRDSKHGCFHISRECPSLGGKQNYAVAAYTIQEIKEMNREYITTCSTCMNDEQYEQIFGR